MAHFPGDARIAYLTQFYTTEQIERFCQGSEDRLDELYADTQPQEVAIETLRDINDGAHYLCDSPDGWVPVEQWRNKGIKQTFRIELENGDFATASDDHLFQRADGAWAYTRDLRYGDELLTKSGSSRLISHYNDGKQVVYDLAIGHDNHRYYTNGISSHNSGKSLFLQNIALNWVCFGLNVVYITLELSEELVALRMDAMVSGKGTSEIFRDLDNTAETVLKISETAGRLTIKKFPEGGTTANDLRAYLKEYQIKTGHKPDAVVVDYLDLMYPNNRRVDPSDLFVKDKFTSEELRGLAHEFDVLCATASQLNRQSIEAMGEFDHSHIAGGISKINTADNVFGIFTTAAMKEKGIYHLLFLKTRSAASVGQKIELSYDSVSMRITDPAVMSDDPFNRKSTEAIKKELSEELARKKTNSTTRRDGVTPPPAAVTPSLLSEENERDGKPSPTVLNVLDIMKTRQKPSGSDLS